jgi:hypothetical protein
MLKPMFEKCDLPKITISSFLILIPLGCSIYSSTKAFQLNFFLMGPLDEIRSPFEGDFVLHHKQTRDACPQNSLGRLP